MKKLYSEKFKITLGILTGLLFVSVQLLAAYTPPTALRVLWIEQGATDQTATCHSYGDYIDNVTLTGPNPSTANIISNNTSAHPAGWHYDYGRSPQLAAGEVTIGQTYNMSITVEGSDLSFQYVAVYVDWNQDNENGSVSPYVADVNENPLTWYSFATGSGSHVLTGSITVPLGTNPGQIYMRVMLDADGGGVSGGDFTTNVGIGEFEDYVLNVTSGTSAPTVTTTAASLISTTSATLGGNVTADGGAAVTDRGIVYSTTDPTPTIAEGATQVAISSATGVFSQSVSPLTQGQTYYFNAYAINTAGTGYGTATSFTTLLPTITSATYDASTGVLSLTCTNITTGDDINPAKMTLTGEGGTTYTLTTANVTASSSTSATVTLNATDKAAINQVVNKNGTSTTGGTTYNLAAADDWDASVTAGNSADATSGITVSNVAVPAITSATYDAATGALVVIGNGYLKLSGATNDIDVSKLTITGEGGSTYTLTTTSVEITSGTSFTVTLNGTDLAAVNLIANKNGTSSTGATTYNLAAAEDWAAGADAAVVVADLTGNGITVSNVAVPVIASATYDAATGALVVTGTGYLKLSGATNDIDVSKLTITGEGGSTYTLTTTSVEITSKTSFTVTLNGTDLAAVNQIANKNGTSSTGATTYNLAAAEDWATGADAAVVVADLTGNGITVSNVAVPVIASAIYDAATGALVVTGTGYLKLSGATNDVDVSKFTLTGEGGTTYTFTDTPDVEITSGTVFAVVLSVSDKAAIALVLNKNGTSSVGGTSYNLAVAEDWAAGADAAVVVADLTGNGITVSNFGATVLSVSVPSNASYANGQNLDFAVIYNESVTVTGTPQISLTVGSTTKQAVYLSGSGTTDLIFRYVVQIGDLDTDGVSVGSVITLNGGTLKNGSSNDASLALNSVGNTSGVLVDAVVPTVSSVVVPSDGTYITGQNLDFTVNFSESVVVVTSGGTPYINLTVGSTSVHASYLSGSGTTAVSFRYQVVSGNLDIDGIALGTLISNGVTIKDAALNDATLTLNSVGSTSGVLVDAVVPTVSSVGVPSDGTYLAGQNLDFTVDFSESVVVVTSGGTPYIALTIGSSSVHASYLSGSGTIAVTFRYQVVSDNLDIDGITLGTLAANGGTIKDAATNNATLTLNSVGNTSGVLVDAVVPTVSSVGVPSGGTYLLGHNLDFTVNFSEPVLLVTSGGTPYITLTIGSSSVHAGYLSGSGTTAITFRYQVVGGNLDIDGITVGALTVNGGTIKDAATNDATLTLNSVGNTSGVLVDAIVPTVSSVGVPSVGTYLAGQNLDFTVNFSEPVVVLTGGGTPYLTLTIGSSSVHSGYLSGSGTSAVIFRYQVVTGNLDIDGITVGTLTANSGTIKDAAANDATLTLISVGNTSGVLVDALAPTVSNVSSETANGTYKLGDVISIQVTFSEAATITGTPTLALNSGGFATYSSGSGTSSLAFSHTVGSGQSSADLDYSTTSSLALAGGTIQDAAGNDATLALPTVGGVSSLGGQKDLVIGIVPTITTQAVSNIGSTTAMGVGNITSLGFPNPISYGVCWNTGGTPTTSDSKVDKGSVSATGAFTVDMTLLAMGTTYHVRAFATNAAGTSYGSEVSFTTTTTTISDAPTGISASSRNGYAKIYFTAPVSDGGSLITLYTVTSDPEGITASGTTSPINITGLTVGERYTFTVTATNAIGTSLPSSASNSVIISTTPDRPVNITAIAGNRQATVSFDVPAYDGASSIYGYTVTSNPGGIIKFGASSPIIVTGLTNGVSYTFTVFATNSRGNGDASLPSHSVTPATVPGAPSGVMASMGNGELMISFASPESDGGSVITGYTVTSNPGDLSVTGTSSPIIVSGLTNGTSYTFVVAATNVVGTGDTSPTSEPFTLYAWASEWKGIGNWDEASKWDNGMPSPQTIITIDGDVTLTANTSVNKISNFQNSTLTIAANKTLTVTDTIKNYGTIVNTGAISGAVLVPVVFEENGGSGVSDLMKLYGSSFDLPQPLKSGYVLENWYTDKELTHVYVSAPMPLNRLMLYAKWKFPTEVITLEEETLKLYPNPTTTGFTITAGSKETLLTISDLNGRKVLSRQVSGVDYVNVSNLVPGIYMVRMNGQNCKLVKR